MCYYLCVRYTWDKAKAASNLAKHRVSFREASTVFADPHALISEDATHEERLNVIGHSDHSRLLFVVALEVLADQEIRIISARRATAAEREAYEEP